MAATPAVRGLNQDFHIITDADCFKHRSPTHTNTHYSNAVQHGHILVWAHALMLASVYLIIDAQQFFFSRVFQSIQKSFYFIKTFLGKRFLFTLAVQIYSLVCSNIVSGDHRNLLEAECGIHLETR